MGVDGVDQDDGDVIGQGVVKSGTQGSDLGSRPAETFNAVGRRHGKENMTGVGRADTNNIGCQFLSLPAAFWMNVVFYRQVECLA